MPPDFRSFDRTLLLELAQTEFGKSALSAPIRYFDATLIGGAHIPRDGGALLVGNHALFALDGIVLGALLVRETGRMPRFLGERNLWKVPLFGRWLTALGALPGEPVAATELLSAGELVVVYPGGVDDSFKSSADKYQLMWGARAGFARIAMRAKVPIVPVVGLGIDDMYDVVGREKWIGRRLFGSSRYDFPIARGAYGTLIPKRAKQTYCVLPPIDVSGDPDSPSDVERVRAATHDALDATLKRARTALAVL